MSDAILTQAKKDFLAAQKWEAIARSHYIQDTRFANGDAYNLFQWPENITTDRKVQDRPCLTTNITRQHNLQIINDAKQNKPGIKFRAVGGGASKAAADVWDGIVRRIEYESNFGAILDTATKTQVDGGVGYWRVVTEYEDDESFNQVVKIKAIPNPLNVYIDPNAQEVDKSDAKFCFIFSDELKSDFEKKYPKYKGALGTGTALGEEFNWVTKEHIRVAEYFRTVMEQDQLLLIPDPDSDETLTVRKSDLDRASVKMLKSDAAVKTRDILVPKIKWHLIVGNQIVESQDWEGKYLPIVQVVGEELILDGVLDRKGHTRALLDAQRMYNYWNSAAVEFVALQSKTPWVATAEAVDGFEDDWANANVENLSLLLYNGKAEDGTDIPPPRRIEPPVQAMGYVQGAAQARQEMMMASGQYENTMGQPGNERTGKAISERQRQGDRATYHFINNLGLGIRHTGVILYDLIPKIYDTKRVMQLMGEDGVDYAITLDPNGKAAEEKRKSRLTEEVQQIFNPTIGKFAVYADLGPGYATRREEAWNAFNTILTQSPHLTSLIGDLLLSAGDFPLAQDAAERLRRMVPKAALGEGPGPEAVELQQQLEQAKTLIGQLTEEAATLRIASKSKEEANIVSAYKGQTDRLKVLSETTLIPQQVLQGILEALLQDGMETMMQRMAMQTAKEEHLPPGPGNNDSAHAAAASLPGQMNPLMAVAHRGAPQGLIQQGPQGAPSNA